MTPTRHEASAVRLSEHDLEAMLERAAGANSIQVRENGAAGGAREPDDRRAWRDVPGDALPLRAVAQQAVLRQLARQGRVPGPRARRRRELALKIAELIGPVTITPKPNGPLIVVGRLEVNSGTGRELERIERTVLCRRGNSGSKPFCDGTYKRIGFEAR